MHLTASRTLALAATILLPPLLGCGSGDTHASGSTAGAGAGNGSGTSSGTSGLGGASAGSGTASTGSAATSSGADGGPARACPAAADVISDFEEDALVVEPAFSKPKGSWYSYNDATATGTQALTVETKTAPTTCDMYDMHASATGYPMYSGFGVTFSSTKTPESFSTYTGLQFDILSDGTNDPMWVEILTTENQPASGGGTATNASVNEYNTSGILLSSIATTYTTVYLPFGILGPRYLPSGCAAGVFCEAPAFDPTSMLGLQFSVVNEFLPAGQYNVSIDNVEVMTSATNGLAPAPTTAGAAFPFPQDSAAVGSCAKPTGATGKFLTNAYAKWKSTFVVAAGNNLRVQRPQNNNDSVSEGIGYGMLIAVYMNDQALFNGLWGYWQSQATAGSLMNWDIPGGNGSATDADEDAAFALLMAAKQWGSTGSVNYQAEAQTVIGDIWANDVQSNSNGNGAVPIVTGGSSYGGSGSALTNPSYFAPAYYRVFAAVDTPMNPSHNWAGVATNVYTYLGSITKNFTSNGLVPAWCQNGCTVAGGTNNANNNEYQYDAHRVPWRIGLDACWNNNADAKAYVALLAGTNGFFQTESVTAGLGSLGDIYQLSGAKDATAEPNSMSLIGAMGVGAMAAGNAALATRAYRFILDATYSPDPVGAVKAYTYYNATVGLLMALTMSGNFNNF
jgi:endo-1,4-beta-D-glucanase Y